MIRQLLQEQNSNTAMNVVPGDLLLDSSKIMPFPLQLKCYLPSKYDIQKQHASNSRPWGTAMNIIQINSEWHFGKSPLEVRKGTFSKHLNSAKIVGVKPHLSHRRQSARGLWSQKNGSHIISNGTWIIGLHQQYWFSNTHYTWYSR